ncbi:MAG: D-glycero-beta-D-manno-heptose-7-phosphate kinase [Magnetococcales bacterium]|nr:D-glycero-beta-D-manno-heptose-7-phosphate kinase [Magnetococcales bacterium]
MFDDRRQVLAALASGFSARPVLVVGDLMLDQYHWGSVGRISPEAPVPVVLLEKSTESAGGAANVAFNLANLGLKVELAGLVGDDVEGRRLGGILTTAGVGSEALVKSRLRPTITKTRVIGGHQQMLRLDRESLLTLSPGEEDSLLQAIARLLERRPPAVIVLSDYAKGVLSERVCQRLIALGRQLRIPVLVDPKGRDFEKYRHATALSPNRQELLAALPGAGETPLSLERLVAAGDALRDRLGLDFLAVTLSEQGIALIEANGSRHLPAMAREVFDVSGAGDTVIATLAAGLAAGLSRMDALHLANLAAGIVVGKVGTTPITLGELALLTADGESREPGGKVVERDLARNRVEEWKGLGQRVVFTNGCFDLLHLGHITCLEAARNLGDRLVVGLNSDTSVKTLKGPTRPIQGEADRARILAALAAVDLVVLFSESTPLTLIEELRPDILVKGNDYTEDQVVGGDRVKSWGGRVVLVPLLAGRSTTMLVEAAAVVDSPVATQFL